MTHEELMALPELKEYVVLWREAHEPRGYYDGQGVFWVVGSSGGVRYRRRG